MTTDRDADGETLVFLSVFVYASRAALHLGHQKSINTLIWFMLGSLVFTLCALHSLLPYVSTLHINTALEESVLTI